MGRFGFVARRLVLAVPMLLGVAFSVFLILELSPGDPARQIVGLRASEEELDAVREERGLNEPMVVRYGDYVADLARGDLGYSYKSNQPVSGIVGERLEVTVWLLTVSVLLTVLIAVPLAVVSVRRRDGPTDHAIRAGGLVGLSMPSFWVGVMLLVLVALPTGWFPAGGFGDTTADKVRSIFLPALTLAIGMSPVLIRSLRASMASVYSSDYVATARSIGVSGNRLLRRFVLRNAASASVTILALEIGYLLFGAVVVETTFALPGIGQGLVVAARSRDLPSVQGYTLVFGLAVVGVYLVSDIIAALLDPRVEIRA